MTRYYYYLVVLFFITLPFTSVEAGGFVCPAAGGESVGIVRIAVLYRDPGITGRSQFDGIEAALTKYHESFPDFHVCLVRFPYRSEKHGYARLKEIAESNKEIAHLVFGPTDSGIMQNAVRNHEIFRKAKLPVISSIVATEVEFSEDSWLFTTNPDIGVRTSKIRTFLGRHGVDSIGILYQDNEYGLQSEKLFREGISSVPGNSGLEKRYQAIRFSSTHDLSQGIDQVIANRPGAIGIFASRLRVKDFIAALEYQNHGYNPYSPLLFTAVDVRAFQKNGLHFVSLKTKQAEMNEVYALAYDTTWFMLDLIHKLKPLSQDTDNWAAQFQDGLIGLFSGSSERGAYSGMFFDGGKNLASPGVFTFENGSLKHVSEFQPVKMVWGPFIETRLYLENLLRRYGCLPILNILIVALLVYWLTRHDLSQWNEDTTPGVQTKKAIRKVVLFNISVALLLYLFLVVSDSISWGALSAAIAVGLGYTALLKSTFGKTESGRTIGVSEYYEDHLRHLHDNLMEAKHHEKKATVDVIAMTNTLPKMREILHNIYRCNSPKRFEELKDQLDKDLSEALGSLEKRRIYAMRLRLRLDWDELRRRKLVPPIMDEDDLIGPDDILDVGVAYLWGSGTKTSADLKGDLDMYIAEVEKTSPERAGELKTEMEAWLSQAATERGQLRCYLRVLFMRDQFEIGKIVHRGYLPDDARVKTSDKTWWSQYKWDAA